MTPIQFLLHRARAKEVLARIYAGTRPGLAYRLRLDAAILRIDAADLTASGVA